MKELLSLIESDLIFYGGTSLGKKFLTFFFKHSFRVMFNYRLGHYLFKKRRTFLNLILIYLKHRQLKYSSCHFSYESTIGRHFNLPHPVGIVIGKGAIVHDRVTVYQNCTLGQKSAGEYPVLHEKCIIYPGSVIIGNISIGYEAVVGANSFVNKSIPDRSFFHNNIRG